MSGGLARLRVGAARPAWVPRCETLGCSKKGYRMVPAIAPQCWACMSCFASYRIARPWITSPAYKKRSGKWPDFDPGRAHAPRTYLDYSKDACSEFLRGFKDPSRCRRCGWREDKHPGDPVVLIGAHCELAWHGDGAYRAALFASVPEVIKWAKGVQDQKNQKQGSLFG